jgi:hypothetical protein
MLFIQHKKRHETQVKIFYLAASSLQLSLSLSLSLSVEEEIAAAEVLN